MPPEDHTNQAIQFVPGGTLKDLDQVAAAVIPWMHESSARYFDQLLGGLLDVSTVIGSWLRKPASEYGVGRMTVAVREQDLIGGFVAGPGPEMTKARGRDLISLLRLGDSAVQAELARRLSALKLDLGSMDDGDFYLRALGVAAPWRGRGVGAQLLAEFIRQGCAAGYRRLRLDVYEENQRAIQLYQAAGFEVSARASSPALGATVLAMARNIQAT